MENNVLWITPLILLLGVALLTLSTSARHERVRADLSRPLATETSAQVMRELLLRRSMLLRHALVGLYVGFGLFACAGALGGIVALWLHAYTWTAVGLTSAGIASLLLSTIELVRESLMATALAEGSGAESTTEDAQ